MTNEAHVESTKTPVEVNLKSYSGKPEHEDGYDIVIRAEATQELVDHTVSLAVRARILCRLAITAGNIDGLVREVLLAESIETLKDEAAAAGVEGYDPVASLEAAGLPF